MDQMDLLTSLYGDSVWGLCDGASSFPSGGTRLLYCQFESPVGTRPSSDGQIVSTHRRRDLPVAGG